MRVRITTITSICRVRRTRVLMSKLIRSSMRIRMHKSVIIWTVLRVRILKMYNNVYRQVSGYTLKYTYKQTYTYTQSVRIRRRTHAHRRRHSRTNRRCYDYGNQQSTR